jgi:hypothetical protein
VLCQLAYTFALPPLAASSSNTAPTALRPTSAANSFAVSPLSVQPPPISLAAAHSVAPWLLLSKNTMGACGRCGNNAGCRTPTQSWRVAYETSSRSDLHDQNQSVRARRRVESPACTPRVCGTAACHNSGANSKPVAMWMPEEVAGSADAANSDPSEGDDASVSTASSRQSKRDAGVRPQSTPQGSAGARSEYPARDDDAGPAPRDAGPANACEPVSMSAPDACNGRDDDCDGKVDEDCFCSGSQSVECYDGPAGTRDVGRCRAGQRHCEGGVWGACSGAVVPQAESCNGIDDDCNGVVDDGFALDSDPQHCGSCETVCTAGRLPGCCAVAPVAASISCRIPLAAPAATPAACSSSAAACCVTVSCASWARRASVVRSRKSCRSAASQASTCVAPRRDLCPASAAC